MSDKKYIYAVGRRKSSTAIVKLFPQGTGQYSLTINGKQTDPKSYFKGISYLLENVFYPMSVLDKKAASNYDAEISVHGGGIAGQADAIRLAFARALVEFNAETRPTIKPHGLLQRDPRTKERKKFGLKGARRSPQWSKR